VDKSRESHREKDRERDRERERERDRERDKDRDHHRHHHSSSHGSSHGSSHSSSHGGSHSHPSSATVSSKVVAPSASPTPAVTRVFVWSLDETLIVYKSILADKDKAVKALGVELEKQILYAQQSIFLWSVIEERKGTRLVHFSKLENDDSDQRIKYAPLEIVHVNRAKKK